MGTFFKCIIQHNIQKQTTRQSLLVTFIYSKYVCIHLLYFVLIMLIYFHLKTATVF